MDNGERGHDNVSRVAQAMSIVSAQSDCTVDEALVLMNERAFISRCTLYEIVDAVLDSSIRFDE